jgi:pSer/pThr/pTyr-binding forkhead associated (FHA) protein/outer membrane protein assembly factor BamB
MAVDKTQIRTVNSQWFLLDSRGNSIELTQSFTVGREADNHLVLTEGAVSRYHATITIVAGTPILSDNDSSNGSFVNGVRTQKSELKAGDKLRFDVVELELSNHPLATTATPDNASAKTMVYSATDKQSDKTEILTNADTQKTEVWQAANVADGGTLIMSGSDMPKVQRASSHNSSELQGIDDPVAGRNFSLNKDKLTVGRSPLNDIIIKTNCVSSHHAHFERSATGWQLSDDGSSNGTFVNGHQIEEAQLKSGDRIKFGDVQLDFDPAGASAPATSSIDSHNESLAKGHHGALFAGLGAGILVVLVAIAWLLMQKSDPQTAIAAKPLPSTQLSELWTVSLANDRIFMGPVVANVRDDSLAELIFSDDRGNVTVFDSRTGLELNRISGIGSAFAVAPIAIDSPNQSAASLLVVSIDSKVTRLNGLGQILWSTDLGPRAKGVFAQPTVVETAQGKLITVPTMGRGIVALHADHGRILWDSSDLAAGEVLTQPVSNNMGQLLFISRDGNINAIDTQPTYPQLRWQTRLPAGELPLSIQTHSSGVLTATNQGTLSFLNQHNGEIIWQTQLEQLLFSAPKISKDRIFAVDHQGGIHIINVADGTTVQQLSVAAPVQANITLWQDQLLIADGHGKLHQISHDGQLLMKQRAVKADEFVQAPWVGDLELDGEIDIISIALNGTLTRYIAQ